jgi:pimeloyl-ACP methyl ester carboxylesterase
MPMADRITAGDVKNPALLLLHAYGAHPKIYGELLDILARDFFVTAPLCAGLQGYSSVDFSENTAAMLKIIRETGAEIVIGHSYGGAMAYHLACELPQIREVILLNPLIPAPMDWSRAAESARLLLRDLMNSEGDLRQSAKNLPFIAEYAVNILRDPASFFAGLPSANAAGHPQKKSGARASLYMGQRDFMFPVNKAYEEQVQSAFSEYRYISMENYAHFWPFFRQRELSGYILSAKKAA